GGFIDAAEAIGDASVDRDAFTGPDEDEGAGRHVANRHDPGGTVSFEQGRLFGRNSRRAATARFVLPSAYSSSVPARLNMNNSAAPSRASPTAAAASAAVTMSRSMSSSPCLSPRTAAIAAGRPPAR